MDRRMERYCRIRSLSGHFLKGSGGESGAASMNGAFRSNSSPQSRMFRFRKETVMKLFWLMALTALVIESSSALNVNAQDGQVMIKNKGGVTTIKDKTKPVRREFEAIYAEGVRA